MAKKEISEGTVPANEKLKALQAAMANIEKNFGKGSIMKMGDESIESVEVIPTGSIGLNAAIPNTSRLSITKAITQARLKR